jgi:hypothetical protein
VQSKGQTSHNHLEGLIDRVKDEFWRWTEERNEADSSTFNNEQAYMGYVHEVFEAKKTAFHKATLFRHFIEGDDDGWLRLRDMPLARFLRPQNHKVAEMLVLTDFKLFPWDRLLAPEAPYSLDLDQWRPPARDVPGASPRANAVTDARLRLLVGHLSQAAAGRPLSVTRGKVAILSIGEKSTEVKFPCDEAATVAVLLRCCSTLESLTLRIRSVLIWGEST